MTFVWHRMTKVQDMADNQRYCFKLSPVAQKRQEIRKKAIEDERIRCFMRMVEYGETNEKIVLYTSLSLETVEKLRTAYDDLRRTESSQKSMAFQHHGLSFHPRKYPWYRRVIMYIKYTYRRKPPRSLE